ncbi:MAG: cysteine--tRNA ligase [Thaumarchaeota archaeon]|nr:cysteine--tRNA ligase [Nitrososphaerota archaeon]
MKRLLSSQDNSSSRFDVMALKVFDSLFNKKRRLEPLVPKQIKMFVCGPTVYDHLHLGHARTLISYDIMARYLTARGYNVVFIVNITDIDDKIFERAKEEGMHHLELVEKYVNECKSDLSALGINTVTAFPRASEYMEELIRQVQGLLDKRYAYVSEGNIYYDTSRFADFGKLSHQTRLELKLKRLDSDPAKKNQADFVLWRSRDIEEPTWLSPFGRGRPGWHIEDTAITISNFGSQYDIHGGAEELIYPHHEAEIAQAEALTGVSPFVKYWLHTGLLYVDGRKMSKSLGNYVTVKEALKRYGSDTIRLYVASHHYRRPVNFHEEGLKKAKLGLQILEEAFQRLEDVSGEGVGRGKPLVPKFVDKYSRAFCRAMDDDFNTPAALKALTSMAKTVGKMSDYSLRNSDPSSVMEAFRVLASILGVPTQRSLRIPLKVACK